MGIRLIDSMPTSQAQAEVKASIQADMQYMPAQDLARFNHLVDQQKIKWAEEFADKPEHLQRLFISTGMDIFGESGFEALLTLTAAFIMADLPFDIIKDELDQRIKIEDDEVKQGANTRGN